MDLINQINLGSKFMRPIKSINRFIQAHSNVYQKKKKKTQQLQAFLYIKKIERFLAKKDVFSGGVLGLNILCKGCSNHTVFVGLLYPGGDKLEKVCIGYKTLPTKGLNFLRESECCA